MLVYFSTRKLQQKDRSFHLIHIFLYVQITGYKLQFSTRPKIIENLYKNVKFFLLLYLNLYQRKIYSGASDPRYEYIHTVRISPSL
jgi:hypothetical protein